MGITRITPPRAEVASVDTEEVDELSSDLNFLVLKGAWKNAVQKAIILREKEPRLSIVVQSFIRTILGIDEAVQSGNLTKKASLADGAEAMGDLFAAINLLKDKVRQERMRDVENLHLDSFTKHESSVAAALKKIAKTGVAVVRLSLLVHTKPGLNVPKLVDMGIRAETVAGYTVVHNMNLVGLSFDYARQSSDKGVITDESVAGLVAEVLDTLRSRNPDLIPFGSPFSFRGTQLQWVVTKGEYRVLSQCTNVNGRATTLSAVSVSLPVKV